MSGLTGTRFFPWAEYCERRDPELIFESSALPNRAPADVLLLPGIPIISLTGIQLSFTMQPSLPPFRAHASQGLPESHSRSGVVVKRPIFLLSTCLLTIISWGPTATREIVRRPATRDLFRDSAVITLDTQNRYRK